MTKLFDLGFREVLDKAASSDPTPGGGSISGVVGSFGQAMVAMVANLTIGKKKYAEYEEKAKEVLAASEDILERLEDLVEEDIQAFDTFMEVLRMPKSTQEEKATRTARLQEALKGATETPLKLASTCLEGLKLAREIANFGNTTAISDVGVGAYSLEAAVHSVLLNVDINAGGIKDKDFVASARKRQKELAGEASALREETVEKVLERM